MKYLHLLSVIFFLSSCQSEEQTQAITKNEETLSQLDSEIQELKDFIKKAPSKNILKKVTTAQEELSELSIELDQIEEKEAILDDQITQIKEELTALNSKL